MVLLFTPEGKVEKTRQKGSRIPAFFEKGTSLSTQKCRLEKETLPETHIKSPIKIGETTKGKDRLQNHPFVGAKMLVSGRVIVLYNYMYIWVFLKIGGTPPNHPFVHRVSMK